MFLLQRTAITAQPNRRENECRGEEQSKPKTGRAQVCGRRELWAVDRVHVKSEGGRCESHQTVFQHRGEMGSAECDPLEKRDRKKRQDCPKKSCSPRPA